MKRSIETEPPLKVESREQLVYLFGEACEIEHGLMCEYMYAQFSLQQTSDEGVTPEQLARIQAWELTLVEVIKQEMLHRRRRPALNACARVHKLLLTCTWR